MIFEVEEGGDKHIIDLSRIGFNVDKAIITTLIEALTSLPADKNYVKRFYFLRGNVWMLFDRRRIHMEAISTLGHVNIILVYPFSVMIIRDKIHLIDSTGSIVIIGHSSGLSKEDIEDMIDSSFRKNSEGSMPYKHIEECVRIRCDDPEMIGFFGEDEGGYRIEFNYIDNEVKGITPQWEAYK